MSRLHEAAWAGRPAEVKALLAAGLDPNGECQGGDERWASVVPHPTPLHCALMPLRYTPRQVQVVKLLLRAGADVHRSHLQDFLVEATGDRTCTRIWRLLARHAPRLVRGQAPWEVARTVARLEAAAR